MSCLLRELPKSLDRFWECRLPVRPFWQLKRFSVSAERVFGMNGVSSGERINRENSPEDFGTKNWKDSKRASPLVLIVRTLILLSFRRSADSALQSERKSLEQISHDPSSRSLNAGQLMPSRSDCDLSLASRLPFNFSIPILRFVHFLAVHWQ